MDRFLLGDGDLYVKTLDVSGKLSLLSRKGRVDPPVNKVLLEESILLLLAVVDLGVSSDAVKRSMYKERVRVSCLKSLAILDLLSRTGEIGRVLYVTLANDIDVVIKGLGLNA